LYTWITQPKSIHIENPTRISRKVIDRILHLAIKPVFDTVDFALFTKSPWFIIPLTEINSCTNVDGAPPG